MGAATEAALVGAATETVSTVETQAEVAWEEAVMEVEAGELVKMEEG